MVHFLCFLELSISEDFLLMFLKPLIIADSPISEPNQVAQENEQKYNNAQDYI
jgi:hypothetical protein